MEKNGRKLQVSNQKLHIIIVGAGASGLIAAISAAQAGARVTVLEQKEKAGKKILATGNGHCNFTNRRMDAACYHENEFAMDVIRRFDVEDTLAFFRSLGIFPHERNGYYYPMSEQASAVAALLANRARELGAEILTGMKVQKIRPLQGELELQVLMQIHEEISAKTGKKEHRLGKKERSLKKKEESFESRRLYADRVILACGGQASPALGSDGSGYQLAVSLGHSLVKPLPALTGIQCREEWFKQLAGVRVPARVAVLVNGREAAADTGELQLTDYGISGIPVFQVSRYAAKALDAGKKVQAELSFFPEIDDEELADYLKNHSEGCYEGLYPAKLLAVLRKLAADGKQDLLELTRHLRCSCREVNGFDRAQVTSGGIPLQEINRDTLESLCCPGVYAAGELLDVDGICGGYNLQWAWSSGWLAGRAAAGK